MKTDVTKLFLNEGHVQRFNQLVEINEQFASDKFYCPTGYLLSVNSDVFHKILPFVKKSGGIRFNDILGKDSKVDLTSGSYTLVRFAMDLFKGGGVNDLTITDLDYLDFDMVRAYINAIKLYLDYDAKQQADKHYKEMCRQLGI